MEVSCAALAVVQQQGRLTELKSKVDNLRSKLREEHLHSQLEQNGQSFMEIKVTVVELDWRLTQMMAG